MSTKHIMLDLETLGTKPYSVILSIGVVHFDPETPGVFRDNFEVMVDAESSVASGLRMDASTVMWWMQPQQDKARQHYLDTLKFELPLALIGFTQWLDHICTDPATGEVDREHKDVRIWGNGAGFDNVLLRNAYDVTNMECPWKHYQDRCFRTVKALDPKGICKPVDGELPTKGTPHTALYDAYFQASWMQNIVDNFKVGFD